MKCRQPRRHGTDHAIVNGPRLEQPVHHLLLGEVLHIDGVFEALHLDRVFDDAPSSRERAPSLSLRIATTPR